MNLKNILIFLHKLYKNINKDILHDSNYFMFIFPRGFAYIEHNSFQKMQWRKSWIYDKGRGYRCLSQRRAYTKNVTDWMVNTLYYVLIIHLS